MRRLALLTVTVGSVLLSLVSALPASATTITAKSLLSRLPVRAEAGSASYARTAFRYPIDADRNSCNTRAEVLISESAVQARRTAGCRITTGRWRSAYDGRTWTRSVDVSVDHLVAFREAWESGARRWSARDRQRFANDLAFGWSLNVMTDELKVAKGARDPKAWLPPRAKCAYAKHWLAVKYRWRLTIDRGEKAKLASILVGACGAKRLTVPPRVALGSTAPRPTPSVAPSLARNAVGNVSAPSNTAAATVRSPAPITVMAVGDIACAPSTAVTARECRHGDVAQVISQSNPNYFIPLGDLQYPNATYAEFTGAGAYNSVLGTLKSRTLPVIGNHEHWDPAGPGQGYFDYFYGPGVAAGSYGTRGSGYYTLTIGSWQFIGLNTECTAGQQPVPGGCGVGSPQYQWLESVLASSTARCTVVAMHRPRWTTGAHQPYGEMGALWDLMVRARVDVALAGHNHSTEVFKRIGASGTSMVPVLDAAGIRSFVAGGGGKALYGFRDSSSAAWAAVQARNATVFGPLRLTLRDGSFDWAYVPIPGQTYTDTGRREPAASAGPASSATEACPQRTTGVLARGPDGRERCDVTRSGRST